jgi:hypothetical protein
MNHKAMAAIVCLFLTCSAMFVGTLASGGEWRVKLDVKEHQGVSGRRRVTCGVPLLAGQAQKTSELRLARSGPGGKLSAVPAQFRALARWWRPSTGSGQAADDSIRWVLVDFATDVKAGTTETFYLTNAKLPVPATPLAVKQDENFITVDTGAARFVVNRKAFNFLEKAVVDVNGDGKLTDDENLLAATPECGGVLEDTFGQKYRASAGTVSVEVIESGPMRVCVRARGKNLAPAGKGYSPGMYGYDVFLNFYSGGTAVFADVVLGNHAPKSIGIPAFEDGSLVLRLAGGAKGFRLLGEKPVAGALAAGESACIYQDSNGADTWKECSGFGKMRASGWRKPKDADGKVIQFTTFRGYKVLKRAAGKEQTLASGNHARGTLHAWNDRGGVVAHVKNFWQQFPMATEVGADGTVRLGLWPREWKWPNFLTDGEAKGHEIVLHFYPSASSGQAVAGKTPGGQVKDAAEPPLAESVADRWGARVFALPTLEHRAATGALSDLGPYTPPTKGMQSKPSRTKSAHSSKMFTTDRLYGNAFGRRVFGERWRSQGGHGSRGARQPIDQDNYLWRWYVTGVPEWLAIGDARSRQYRDVRCYRFEGYDALGFKNWAAFRVANRSERREWTNRPQPKNDEIKKYRQGLPSYGTSWEFPNPEHCVLDLLYDRYLIFGDVRSLENMRIAAGHGGYFALGYVPKPGKPIMRIGRAKGWSWRTLERYWELTGDKRAGEMLKDIIKAHEPMIGKENLWFRNNRSAHASGWFTQIFSRAAAMTALHSGDPKMLEICKALAVGKDKPQPGSINAHSGKQSRISPRQFSTLFAVLYHLTGEEKYKKPVAKYLEGDSLLSSGGYFPASDHWLLKQPPKRRKEE